MAEQQYKAPPTIPSSVGPQANTQYYVKKALVELAKERYFGQMADSFSMPKHYGKKIVRDRYLPLLDDQNINDQGIDALGVTIDTTKFTVTLSELVDEFVVEADATAAAAAVNAVETGVAVKTGASTPWTVTYSKKVLPPATAVLADAVISDVPGSQSQQGSGNMYGSSKDIGLVSGKFPHLSETGGRVNRVGSIRKQLEGTFANFGIFREYTEDSYNFDSDSELMEHINREMLFGANELCEDMLQIDLLNNAGVVRYTGAATSFGEIGATPVTYRDLLQLSITLDNNRTPKKTKVFTGSRMTDTKTIPAARVMYIGSELQPMFEEMQDLHSRPAFIPVQQYGSGATILNGEIGTVGYFRLVVVPEMMKHAGKGADATGNTTEYATNNKLDIFPMLVLGDEAFTTIGFQTSGSSTKFKIIHRKPGEKAADRTDPYGKTGFMSMQWWYGFMALKNERMAVQWTAAAM